mmetsp:Transcript_39878/g.126232  ORF Transcript_39878/g.126232 Transcript_39878/m.126232 type:complete len:430 (+) Transcript_39878:69-1358(+)
MEAVYDFVEGESNLEEVYEKAIVVRAHHPPGTDVSQLRLDVHDIVCVVEQDATGWWGGHKEGDGEGKGWFPGSCVRILPAEAPQAMPQMAVAQIAAQMVAAKAKEDPSFGAPEGLQTQHRSPVRRTSLVASPQRALQFSPEEEPRRRSPSGGAAGGPEPEVSREVRQELARLREENEDLKRQYRSCKRQSDMDRERLERELIQERQKRGQLERDAASRAAVAAAAAAAAPASDTRVAAEAQRWAAAKSEAPVRASSLMEERFARTVQRQQQQQPPVAAHAPTAQPALVRSLTPAEALQVELAATLGLVVPTTVVTERPQWEEPRRGMVAEKLSLFNTMRGQNQVQQRSSSCSGPRYDRSARSLTDESSRAAPAPTAASPAPVVASLAPMAAYPRAFSPAAGAECPEARIVSLGMSPMARCRRGSACSRA